MIEKLEIRNYRSCLETSLSLQPDLSVLIGPNGSGKTNVLQAILLLKKLVDDRPHSLFQKSPIEPFDETHLTASFRVDDKIATLKADVLLDTDEENSDVPMGTRNVWVAKDFTGTNKQIEIPLAIAPFIAQAGPRGPAERIFLERYGVVVGGKLDLPEPFMRPLAAIAHFLSDIKYYSATQFANRSQCPVSIEIEKEGDINRRRRHSGHAKFLFDLYSSSRTPGESGYEEFFNVVGPRGIGLVSGIEFKEQPTSSVDVTVRSGGKIRERKRAKILIIPQFAIGKNEFSPNQLSEGTFKTIALLFYLITERSSALLIEEPEVCVHHGLLASIVELIIRYSTRKQIVMSTHSDFVLDKIDPRHVYKVARDDEKGTLVTHITDSMPPDELSALKDYLENEGNLGEYWKHGGLEEVH